MILYFDEYQKKIKAYEEAVESDHLTPLTDEQTEYWRQHPKAHWSEILDCGKKDELQPYVAPEPTLEELKADALKKLSDLSLEILGSHVGEYQMMNALLSLRAESYDKIYDDDKSLDLIDIYLEVGKQCRTLFYEAKSAIESADNTETIKELTDGYTDDYEHLRKA